MSKWFSACSEKAASLAGHYLTFIIAILLVVAALILLPPEITMLLPSR